MDPLSFEKGDAFIDPFQTTLTADGRRGSLDGRSIGIGQDIVQNRHEIGTVALKALKRQHAEATVSYYAKINTIHESYQKGRTNRYFSTNFLKHLSFVNVQSRLDLKKKRGDDLIDAREALVKELDAQKERKNEALRDFREQYQGYREAMEAVKSDRTAAFSNPKVRIQLVAFEISLSKQSLTVQERQEIIKEYGSTFGRKEKKAIQQLIRDIDAHSDHIMQKLMEGTIEKLISAASSTLNMDEDLQEAIRVNFGSFFPRPGQSQSSQKTRVIRVIKDERPELVRGLEEATESLKDSQEGIKINLKKLISSSSSTLNMDEGLQEAIRVMEIKLSRDTKEVRGIKSKSPELIQQFQAVKERLEIENKLGRIIRDAAPNTGEDGELTEFTKNDNLRRAILDMEALLLFDTADASRPRGTKQIVEKIRNGHPDMIKEFMVIRDILKGNVF